MLNFGPSLLALSDPHESCYKPGTVKLQGYLRWWLCTRFLKSNNSYTHGY